MATVEKIVSEISAPVTKPVDNKAEVLKKTGKYQKQKYEFFSEASKTSDDSTNVATMAKKGMLPNVLMETFLAEPAKGSTSIAGGSDPTVSSTMNTEVSKKGIYI